MSTLQITPAQVTDVGTLVCTEPGCRDAWSRPELCRCTTCHGDSHGIHLRARVEASRVARLARTGGNPFHGLPVVNDEEKW